MISRSCSSTFQNFFLHLAEHAELRKTGTVRKLRALQHIKLGGFVPCIAVNRVCECHHKPLQNGCKAPSDTVGMRPVPNNFTETDKSKPSHHSHRLGPSSASAAAGP